MVGVEVADISWLAVGAAVVVSIVVGFLWYAPQTPTGRIWMRENKFDPKKKPSQAEMARGFGLMILGSLLFQVVLGMVLVAWRDAIRLDTARAAGLEVVDGLTGGFLVWLGFVVPLLLSTVGWEMKPWSLFGVNAAYYLLMLLVAGAIHASFL